MRITQRAVATTSLAGLNQNLTAIGRLQEQLTSGRTINKPSDSPTGANKSMQTRSEAAATEQYARNISDGKSWLNNSDSALKSMGELSRKVRDLTVYGSNDAALSPEARAAIGVEVAQIRKSLLALANTQVTGRPVFGGITSGGQAYDATTGTFVGRGELDALGDVEGVTRRISEVETVRIEVLGTEAFGLRDDAAVPPVRDLFKIVDDIATNVVSNPVQLQADLADLDTALTRLKNAQSVIGARALRVETAQQVNLDQSLSLQQLLSETENVDLPRTIMELKMQETGYNAALQATAQVIRPTLVDYLR